MRKHSVRAFLSDFSRIFLPLAPVALYWSLNRAHQRNDQAFDLLQTQDAYLSISRHGLSGLLSAYLNRSFRPSMHYFAPLPVLFLTGGRIDLSAAVYCIFSYGFFLYFSLQLLKRYLGSAEQILCLAILGWLPAIVERSVVFSSEASFLPAFAAFIYFLSRCDHFVSARDSILCGLSFGIMACFRPAESVLLGVAIIIPYLALAMKKGTIRARDVGVFLACIGTEFAFEYTQVLDPGRNPAKRLGYLASLVIAALPLGLRKKFHLSNTFTFFAFAMTAPILFWYAPGFFDLWDWIVLSTSKNSYTLQTGGMADLSLFGFVSKVARYYSLWVWIALALIALPGIRMARLSTWTWVIGLLAVVFPLAMGALSWNADSRYYMGSAILAYYFVFVAGFGGFRPGRLRALRWVAGGVIALVLFINFTLSATHGWYLHMLRPWVGGPDIFTIERKPAINALYDAWSQNLPSRSASGEDLALCILQMSQGNDLDWVADPWALTLMAQADGKRWRITRPPPLLAGSAPERYDWVRQNCEYIAVLPVFHVQSRNGHFMSDVGELVLDAWKRKAIDQESLRLRFEGVYEDGMGDSGRYLVFESLRWSGISPGS